MQSRQHECVSKQTPNTLSAAAAFECAYIQMCSCACVVLVTMGSPLFPRESGRFIAEHSRDVFVEEEGVQKVAEMLYNLRHGDDLTAGSWKKANTLAPAATSDQGSLEYA